MNEYDSLTNLQKAAILMIILGEQPSSKVLQYLRREEIELISEEISKIDTVPPQIGEKVLEEFKEILHSQEIYIKGGMDYARKVLLMSLDSSGSESGSSQVKSAYKRFFSMEILKKMSPKQLADTIVNENPQTIAVILSHMNHNAAAETLSHLPDGLRSDVIQRIANLEGISSEILEGISRTLKKKSASAVSVETEATGGLEAVVQLFNRLDNATSKKILKKIEETDSQLATNIKEKLLVFEDIMNFSDFAIRKIVENVDKKLLTKALKGTPPELQEKIFNNISQRAATLVKEEMELMGPVRLKDVEDAQKEILNVIRKLEEANEISVNDSEGANELVF